MKLGVLNQKNIKYCNNLFRHYGVISSHTDFSLLTGGDVPFDYLVSKTSTARADYWTNIQNENGLSLIINSSGESELAFSNQRNIGLRLALKYSDVSCYIKDEKIINNEISEVLLGSYPCDICDEKIGLVLEKHYRDCNLTLSNKKYLINNAPIRKDGFTPYNLDVYCYQDEYYVRVISNNLHPNLRLSNGLIINIKEYCWVKVNPLTWIVDKNNDIMLLKNVILSGIPYRLNKRLYQNEEAFLNLFIDNRLKEDIFENELCKTNGYTFKKIK